MKTDADLLRNYAETSSEPAFAELVRRHVDLVYSAALRQVGGDAHLAQDVAQTVFVDLARKARALAGRDTLIGWLYTSASYAAANAVRRERRRRLREETAHAMNATSAAPDAPPDWDRLRPLLDVAMQELNETDHEAVLLRFFAQHSFPEIGAALRVSQEAARKRVDRALEKLRTTLVKRGLTCTSSALALGLSGNVLGAAPPGIAVTIAHAALSEVTVTTGTTTAASFLLMSKAKAGFFLAVILALTTAWFVENAQLAHARQENADRQSRLARVTAQIAAENQRAARAQAALDARAGLLPLRVAPLPPLTSDRFSLAQERVQLDTNYASLFRELQLDRARLETLKELLAERELRLWQARRFVVAATGRWMDEWANMTEQLVFESLNVRDLDERIQQLLGPEKYGRFAAFEKSRPWRKPFTDLAEQLEPLEPLRDAQVTQLALWAAAANPDLFTDPLKGGPKVPAEVVNWAAAILSPLQHEKLQQLKASTDAYRQMQTWAKPPSENSPAAVPKTLLPSK